MKSRLQFSLASMFLATTIIALVAAALPKMQNPGDLLSLAVPLAIIGGITHRTFFAAFAGATIGVVIVCWNTLVSVH